jgi:hypothetical protein
VAFSGADEELALATFRYLAGDRIFEESVLQSFENEGLETTKELIDLWT